MFDCGIRFPYARYAATRHAARWPRLRYRYPPCPTPCPARGNDRCDCRDSSGASPQQRLCAVMRVRFSRDSDKRFTNTADNQLAGTECGALPTWVLERERSSLSGEIARGGLLFTLVTGDRTREPSAAKRARIPVWRDSVDARAYSWLAWQRRSAGRPDSKDRPAEVS